MLTTEKRGARVVKYCSPLLEEQGLEEGSPLELAQALCPDLHIRPFQPEQDYERLEVLARWALRFSPLVGIDHELWNRAGRRDLQSWNGLYTGIVIDVTGTERVHGGFPKLMKRLAAACERKRLQARLGLAPTIGAAWALSRFSGQTQAVLYEKEKIASVVQPYPLASLRIKEETIEQLQELGIYTVESLFRLPRKKLFERFGALLVKRIDQLLGLVDELFPGVHEAAELSVEECWEHPLTRKAAIEETLVILFQRCFEKAQVEGKTPQIFLLRCEGVDRFCRSFQIVRKLSFHAGCSSEKHLRSIVSPWVEKLTFSGPVERIGIQVVQTTGNAATQADAFQEKASAVEAHERDELVNHLVHQLGGERVRALEVREAHIPEETFRFTPITKRKKKGGKPLPAFSYPPVLLPHPEPVSAVALLPDRPPHRITWKGKILRIIKGFGPERISEPWWRSAGDGASTREYFRLQDETGRWLWVYREKEKQKWFLHGIWS